MRFFIKSLIAIALAAVVAGLLTYPAWLLVSHFADVRADRVMRRIGLLTLAIAFYLLLRREGLANKSTLGYGVPRAQFIRQMSIGFAAGLALMMPLVATLFALHLRTLLPLGQMNIAMLLAQGIATGLMVAFIEETFLRGAMYSIVKRESGIGYAILLTSLLYAAVHFLAGNFRVPATQMHFVSGLQIAAHTFERLAEPLAIADSFCALFALGVLLSLIRTRTDAIAGGIGVHAGGVCVITVLLGLSQVNATTSYGWLIGAYDGVIGWLACGWIALVAVLYWQMSKHTTPSNVSLRA